MNLNFDFNFNFGFAESKKKVETFEEFCELAGYPQPYKKQEQMRLFAFPEDENLRVPRLILGARGYGKTDYITILGLAFEIYKSPQIHAVLMTKEFERGKEIMAEVAVVLQRVGVKMKGQSQRKLYTENSVGKEPTLTTLAVRSKGLRGRHPDMIFLEDLITPDDSSEAERHRVQKVYEEVLKLTSNVVLIGQPVHKLDLLQKLRFLIPTLAVKHGDIPELDVDLIAQRAAGVSEQSIAASYHLEILDDASLPFGNVQTCNYSAPNCVAFVDPSHKGGDYTAIAIGGMHFEFFGVKSVCFETNGLGDEPVIRMRQLGAPCVGLNTTEHKHTKIINCAFFSEHIKLQKIEGNFDSQVLQANQIFIEQVKNYEYRAKHDDSPDATAGLMKYLGISK